MDKVKNCADFASICSFLELFSEDLTIHVSIPQLISSIVQVDAPSSPAKADCNPDDATKILPNNSLDTKDKVNSQDEEMKCELSIEKPEEENLNSSPKETVSDDIPKQENISEETNQSENGDVTKIEPEESEKISNGVNHSDEEDELEIFRVSMSLLPMTPRLRKSWILLHVRLLNKIGVRTQEMKWERGLSKFMGLYVTNLPIDQYYAFESKGYSGLDAINRTKLLAYLLEYQFEKNTKFKEKVNSQSLKRLRPQPLGVDVFGCIYWLFKDPNNNFLLYQENTDDDSIKLLCETIHQLKRLLTDLKSKQECISGITPALENQTSTTDNPNTEHSTQNSAPPAGIPLPLLGPFYKRFIGDSPSTSSAATTENSPRPDNYQNGSSEQQSHETATDKPIAPKTEINSHEENCINDNATVKVESKEDDIIDDSKSEKNESLKEDDSVSPSSVKVTPVVSSQQDESIQINEECNGVRRSGRQRKQVELFGAATQFNVKTSPQKEKAACKSPPKVIKKSVVNKDRKTGNNNKKDSKKSIQKKVEDDDEDEDLPLKNLKNNNSKNNRSKKVTTEVKPVKQQVSTKKKKIKKTKSKVSKPWEGESSDDNSGGGDFDHDFFVEEETESEIDPNLSDNWTDAPESDFDEVMRAGESSDEELLQQRGRNYARQKKRHLPVETIVEVQETPCQICGDCKLPEWLLLCDECDYGFHTMCLRPALMIIPDGDWYCPRCQHKALVEKLEERIKELSSLATNKSKKLGIEERLNFVNISMTNILGGGEELPSRADAKKVQYYSESESRNFSDQSESQSDESSGSSSNSSSEESVEQKRQTRQKREVKYNYDEFDKIIGEAIEDDAKYVKIKKKKEKLKKKEGKEAPEDESEKSDDGSEVEDDEDEEDISDASAPKGKSRGKDMANILGPDWDKSDEDKPKPVARRNRKKLTSNLSSAESAHEDDDDEEFKLSDEDVDSEEEAEEAKFRSKAKSRYRDSDESWDEDENFSDESWSFKPKRETRYSSGRRSSRGKKGRRHKSKHKRRKVDDSDEEFAPRRPRRSAARSRVNYRTLEKSSSDEESDDKHSRKIPSKKTSRRKKLSSEDDEYRADSRANSESDSDEESIKKRNQENQLKKRKRVLQSSSDESNQDANNHCARSQIKRLKEDEEDDEEENDAAEKKSKDGGDQENNENSFKDSKKDVDDNDDIPECSDVLPELNDSDLEAAEEMIHFVVNDTSNSNLYQPNLP